jgi:16S rRNA (uracil1498-N3)-methyltransferase
MQKFLISLDQIKKNRVVIEGQDARHIGRVLRLTPGDTLFLTDGRGMDFTGCITESRSGKVVMDIIDTCPSQTESPLPLTICNGMLKHQKMDEVIKGLTQMGVTRWIPFYCERSVPLPDPKSLSRRMARWQTIAKETIKQCRRSRLVEISSPKTLDDILDLADNFDHCIAFWEQGGLPLSHLAPLDGANHTIVIIGPEGGFSESEINRTSAKGFVVYSLGPRILRAETAALCGAALVQHRLGDI